VGGVRCVKKTGKNPRFRAGGLLKPEQRPAITAGFLFSFANNFRADVAEHFRGGYSVDTFL
ncbi:hypothetical protein, partial [Cronobacter sakazakii]|uniref:hypothetical protein n=1 Tax=Cronobacter sakazakii TaxID=28141 RepID=UPI001958FC50